MNWSNVEKGDEVLVEAMVSTRPETTNTSYRFGADRKGGRAAESKMKS